MGATLISTTELPAILGGRKAVSADSAEAMRWPVIGEEEIAAVTDVLRSGELSLHPVTRQFKDDYRRWLGIKHALACCNGTSAIFAGLLFHEPHPTRLIPVRPRIGKVGYLPANLGGEASFSF